MSSTTSKFSIVSSDEVKNLTEEEVDEMFSEKRINEYKTELENFTKVIKLKPDLLFGICTLIGIDGYMFDPDNCMPIDKELKRHIEVDMVQMLLSGTMKVNGKVNNWSNGCFGSRWFDMDAEKYGIDYIRGAFYSKKHYKGDDWPSKTPYRIELMMEKAKN